MQMTWHNMMHLMHSIASKERRRNYSTDKLRSSRELRCSEQETGDPKKGKRCCTTYGRSGQHHNIEWCNNIVDQGASNNIRGSQDIINWNMHAYHDGLRGIIIIHVKWVHLKHIWQQHVKMVHCIYGKQGCKRKKRKCNWCIMWGVKCKSAPPLH